MKDTANRDVSILLVSAYAPFSSQSDEVCDDYYDKIDRCIEIKRADDILIIGTDVNSSIGISQESVANSERNGSGPVGSFGINI